MSGGASRGPLPRVIALWIPDWPVRALALEFAEQRRTPPSPDASIALLAKNRVAACSPAARESGVRIGLREREAQVRCPGLELHAHDPAVDERHFRGVLSAIERIVPGVEPVRPGLCLMRARGPARYFGGETEAAAEILGAMERFGIAEARIGIACGRFAAEQAARASSSDPHVAAPSRGARIVGADLTSAFLGGLPVERACDERLSEVLRGLGIRTLGALTALPEAAVAERFGPAGVTAHRLASGAEPGPAPAADVSPRTPPPELADRVEFDPPIDGADTLAFACSSFADRFSQRILAQGLVCTDIRIELVDDIGARHERQWTHPRHFTGPDVLNRIRWQTAALPPAPERTGSGISRVELTPIRTARAADHEPGLWSDEADARVHHHLGRVQSLIGPEGVVTLELCGGRMLAERTRAVPWGSRAQGSRAQGSRAQSSRADASSVRSTRMPDGPWPGALPPPLPTTVFTPPIPASLLGIRASGLRASGLRPNEPRAVGSRTGASHAGSTEGGGAEGGGTAGRTAGATAVRIDDDGLLAAEPRMLSVREVLPRGEAVASWSAPWPLRERWWTKRPARFRLQVVLRNGDAWLLVHQRGSWFAEGRYD